MYTIELDGSICYAPNVAGQGYAVVDPVHISEINKADKLTFTVPPNNPLYGTIQQLATDYTLREDGHILSHGRVLSARKDFQNNKKLICEGALAWLNDSIIPPHTQTVTVTSYVAYILNQHNAQVSANRRVLLGTISDVDTDDLDDGAVIGYDVDMIARQVIQGLWGVGTTRRQRLEAAGYSYEVVQNKVNEMLGVSYRYTVDDARSSDSTAFIDVETTQYKTALDCLTGEWLDENGYTLHIRSEDEDGEIVTYLDLLSENGAVGEQEIRFAKNLLDLDEYADASEIYTCVIPLGKVTNGTALTIASVNSGVIYLRNAELAAIYGNIYRTIDHSDIDNATDLLAAGQNDLRECIKGSLSLTIKAVDMTMIRRTETSRVVNIFDTLDKQNYEGWTWHVNGSLTYDGTGPSILGWGMSRLPPGLQAGEEYPVKFSAQHLTLTISARVSGSTTTLLQTQDDATLVIPSGASNLRISISAESQGATYTETVMPKLLTETEENLSEAFSVGSYNRIISSPHGYDEYLQCTKIQRYLQNPERDVYTFGATRNNLSDIVRKG